jgi:hypothetical protein
MNRTFKLILAGLVTIGLALASTSVWAAYRVGTLGPTVHEVHKYCSGNKNINMGDATFSLTTSDTTCNFGVVRTKYPQSFFGPLQNGLVFRSDGFLVTVTGASTNVLVCFAYSPSDASKHSTIWVFNSPNWVNLGGVVSSGSPKQICVSSFLLSGSTTGFALVGNP